MSVHVFVGPTLPASTVAGLRRDAVIHPPVQHGDLLRIGPRPGDVAVIIDGYYHHAGAIRHKEILSVLAGGVRVIGCSSMGALRAVELQPYGMVGNGAVFEMYRSGVIDADDEVAIAHTEPPDYRAFTWPLVSLRHAADAARRAGALSLEHATMVIELARALHYTHRTRRALEPAGCQAAAALHSFLPEPSAHADIKASDAIDTLERLDELTASAPLPPGSWAGSGDWHNQFLYAWRAEFTGAAIEGFHVGQLAVARFHQIYEAATPRRWRRHVLQQIAGMSPADVPADALEAAALEAAAHHGLTPEAVTAEQRGFWLCDRESDELSPVQALLVILVRSYIPERSVLEVVDSQREWLDDASTQRAVAECYAVNSEVATWQPGRDVEFLTDHALRGHLAEVWEQPVSSDQALTAAARDRGFRSLADAIEAARPLFLRCRFAALAAEEALDGNHPGAVAP